MSGRRLPDEAYTVWDEGSDRALDEMFEAGRGLDELAKVFNRTIGAIKSRLRHLGLLGKKR